MSTSSAKTARRSTKTAGRTAAKTAKTASTTKKAAKSSRATAAKAAKSARRAVGKTTKASKPTKTAKTARTTAAKSAAPKSAAPKSAASKSAAAKVAPAPALAPDFAAAAAMIRTASPPMQPAASEIKPIRTHKYRVGETVYYTSPTFGRAAADGSYTVVRLLPTEGDEHQYRIKSSGEAFERVAKESQLDRA